MGRLPHPHRGDRLRHDVFRRGDAEPEGRLAPGQDLRRLGRRQRGALHDREGHAAGRQGRRDVRLRRHGARSGRHRRRQAGVHQGPGLRPARQPQGVRLEVQGRDVPGEGAALGHPVRRGVPLRGREHPRTATTRDPAGQRLRLRDRGGEHAVHARGHRGVPRGEDPLRAGQGLQRRRRGHLGPRDGAERDAPVWTREEVDMRLHKSCEHPQDLPRGRQGGRLRELPGRRQPRGFLKVANAMLAQGVV